MGDGLGPASFKEPNFLDSPLETLPFKMSGWKVIFFFFWWRGGREVANGRRNGGKLWLYVERI